MKSDKLNFFWFRRDLRTYDNRGLSEALKSGNRVQCIFIFDTNILNKLPNKRDPRLVFIHRELEKINSELQNYGGTLLTYHGSPVEVWREIIKRYNIAEVYTNDDYEPYARDRDNAVEKVLHKSGIVFKKFKDHVIFEKSDVLKQDGKPYTVFTPYKNSYLKLLTSSDYGQVPTELSAEKINKHKPQSILSPDSLGFEDFDFRFPSKEFPDNIIRHYAETRDYPSVEGTSRLGIHLRFGTISTREAFRHAIKQKSGIWLSELIWREFFQMILWHFPYASKNAFKKHYDRIRWRNNEKEFDLWKKGLTGYPIVDAGMRELAATGYMHNRVRMITASFLVKHLLIDWRWGEAWFAEKLLDFDLAANNGGWQWAAGSGCDAAPYFRIFNPYEQTKKFDPELKYIRKWVPEIDSLEYPQPVVDHKFARERCLKTYKAALQ